MPVTIRQGEKNDFENIGVYSTLGVRVLRVLVNIPRKMEVIFVYFLDDNHRQNYTAMQLRVKKCKMDNSYLVAAYILSLPELQSKGASSIYQMMGLIGWIYWKKSTYPVDTGI